MEGMVGQMRLAMSDTNTRLQSMEQEKAHLASQVRELQAAAAAVCAKPNAGRPRTEATLVERHTCARQAGQI